MGKIAEKGIVTIAFDDGYLETYESAMPYINAANIKTTVAVASHLLGKSFDDQPIVGTDCLKEMILAGHEIASHGLTHNDLLGLQLHNNKFAVLECAQSKEVLSNLLDYEVRSFVFPFINKDQARSLNATLDSHYTSARTSSLTPQMNNFPPEDRYSLIGHIVTNKHSLDQLNKQVDLAEEKGAWLIEVFHVIGEGRSSADAYEYYTRIDTFKRHIEYMLSKGIVIMPQCEVIKNALKAHMC